MAGRPASLRPRHRREEPVDPQPRRLLLRRLDPVPPSASAACPPFSRLAGDPRPLHPRPARPRQDRAGGARRPGRLRRARPGDGAGGGPHPQPRRPGRRRQRRAARPGRRRHHPRIRTGPHGPVRLRPRRVPARAGAPCRPPASRSRSSRATWPPAATWPRSTPTAASPTAGPGACPTTRRSRWSSASGRASPSTGVEVTLAHEAQHRVLVVFRGEGLSPLLADTDPQKVGVPPAAPRADAARLRPHRRGGGRVRPPGPGRAGRPPEGQRRPPPGLRLPPGAAVDVRALRRAPGGHRRLPDVPGRRPAWWGWTSCPGRPTSTRSWPCCGSTGTTTTTSSSTTSRPTRRGRTGTSRPRWRPSRPSTRPSPRWRPWGPTC